MTTPPNRPPLPHVPTVSAYPSSQSSFFDILRSFFSHLSISLRKLQQFIRHLLSSSPQVRYGLLLLSILGPAFLLIRRIRDSYLSKYRPSSLSHHLLPSYDYIIIGAGTAGCVLANRLSAGGKTVLLIEAGGSDDLLDVSVPAAAIKLQLSEGDWAYQTIEQKNAYHAMKGKRGRWPRGKMLGGCSSINYLLWVRGQPDDYDGWAALGLSGWSWRDVLPFFKKVETAPPSLRAGKGAELRGDSGPMNVEQLIDVNANTKAFVKGCQELGLPLVNDYNGPSSAGVSLCQYNMMKGRRWNAASGYLVPALERPNLHILTYAQVARILFDREKKAERVVFRRGRTTEELRKARDETVEVAGEVILSAGAVNSPHLLMLSGVGDREHLTQHNLDCISHLPGVGQNLQDHFAVPMTWATKLPTLSERDENLTALAQLYLQKRGPLASCMVEALAFVDSKDKYEESKEGQREREDGRKEGGKRIDIQWHFVNGTASPSHTVAFNYRDELTDRYFDLVKKHYTHSILVTLIKPQSTGSVLLANADPFSPPLIDPSYLSHPADVAALASSCSLASRVIRTPAMQTNHLSLHPDYDLLTECLVPDNPFKRGEEDWWIYYIKHVGNTLYHPVGTCKMGTDGDVMSVLDEECRVRGVKGVRVVDASVMPKIVSGNTHWPTLMIAERVSALILQDKAKDKERVVEDEAAQVSVKTPAQAVRARL